jgi:pilus assembly protein TadC
LLVVAAFGELPLSAATVATTPTATTAITLDARSFFLPNFIWPPISVIRLAYYQPASSLRRDKTAATRAPSRRETQIRRMTGTVTFSLATVGG